MERCPLRLTVLAAWLLRHSARLLRPQRHFARHWRPLRIFRLAVGFFLGLLVYNLSLSHAHGQGRPPGGGPGGDPPPNNNWKIEVSYTGQAQSTYMPSSDIVTYNTNVNGINIPANGSLDLSTLSAKHTLTGGISGGLQFVQQIYGNGDFMGTSWGQLSLSNAALTFTLTWQPKNNDPIANPPPSQIVVCYRRQVTAQAYADYVSGLPPGDPD